MKGSGLLTVYDEKIVVEIDPDLGYFYRSLIPKAKGVHGTRYPPHITVVRKEAFPKFVQGFEVSFEYSVDIQHNDVYWWLPVRCRELNEFRISLGLPWWSELCRPPDGSDNFHITIGNTK